MTIRILLLDIETSPNLAHVWGLFKQNVGINQLIESSHTLCWAARWYGEEVTYFDSVHRSSRKQMVKRIHKMLEEADAVVHYNGTKFDIPTLNKEFLLHGLRPPAPYKQVDLLKTARNQFRFPSNKMDYVAQQLKVGKKVPHIGHELWINCMAGDDAAWKMMEEYNVQDIELLEALYDKLRPWIKGHINHSAFTGEHVCPNCGGGKLQKRGKVMTRSLMYQRFQCNDCGTWSRSVVADKADRSKRVEAIH